MELLRVVGKGTLPYSVILSLVRLPLRPIEALGEHGAKKYLQLAIRSFLYFWTSGLKTNEDAKSFKIEPQIIRKELIASKIVQVFAVMVTVGIVYPPLLIMGLLTILSQTYFEELCIVRYCTLLTKQRENNIKSSVSPDLSGQYEYHYQSNILIDKQLAILSANCRRFQDGLLQSLYWLIPVQCAFFAFFVFDILGDAVGASSALWAPVLLLCISGPMMIAYILRLLIFMIMFLHRVIMSTIIPLLHICKQGDHMESNKIIVNDGEDKIAESSITNLESAKVNYIGTKLSPVDVTFMEESRNQLTYASGIEFILFSKSRLGDKSSNIKVDIQNPVFGLPPDDNQVL
jgi:hypothetical protein